MKFNTALSVVLCALSIWPGPKRASNDPDRRRWFAVAAGTIALLTLIEYVGGLDLQIDQLLWPDRQTAASNYPGRMSVVTAVDFLLFAGARWFAFSVKPPTNRVFVGMSLLGVGLSYHAFLGFVYSPAILRDPGTALALAPQTLVSFVALFIGLMELRPDLGWAALGRMSGGGGALIRLSLPVILLLLPLLGWFRLQGELAGYFDTRAGLTLFTSVNILTLSTVIYAAARRMERLDAARQAREADLRRSEDRFRSVVESGPNAIVIVDRAGRIKMVNRQAEILFGHDRSELLESPVDILTPERLRARLPAVRARNFADAGLRSGSVTRERTALRKDGSEVLVETRLRHIETDEGTMLLAVITDITERKNSMAQAGYLAAIVESSADAIISKDLNSIITTWNPTAETLFGYPAEAVIGRHISLLIPSDRLSEENEIIAQIRRGERVEHFETFRRHKDGQEIAVSLTISPIRGTGGEIVGASKIVRDITQRRAIEQQLRQAQKMEVIGQLTGGMAHDFNNLLAIIHGNLELIQERVAADPDLDEMATDALKAAARGASLTHHLLAYSRQQPLEPAVVKLDAVMKDVMALLARTLGETIEIMTVIPADLWSTCIDQHQLENALLNLAVNAKHAMPNGGKLTIEASDTVLDDSYAAANVEVTAGPYIRLAVSDTGTGMTKEILDRVLEPFFTTKPVGQGSGLGLSMVYGFVKQSGGHLKIYSEPGQGTTINLYLPRAPGAGDIDHGKDEGAAPPRRGNEIILVVEDDELVRKLAIRLLTDLGYRPLEAEDGPAALALIEGPEQIDLLLTDIVLPKGISGPALAGQSLQRRPGLKVLYMSGYAREAIGRNALLDEGAHLVSKPFAKAEFARKVRELLDEGRRQ